MVTSRDRTFKAALFLARVLLANSVDEPVEIDAILSSEFVHYEGITLQTLDLAGGAMVLLRGLIADVAQLQELESVDVARTLELFTATADAVFGYHDEEWPDDENEEIPRNSLN